MRITFKFFFSLVLILAAIGYIFPWKHFGINTENTFLDKSYTLGLDLQWGVELDYQVDLSQMQLPQSDEQQDTTREDGVVESLKMIIDKRVSSLGLSEPNIQTLKYGTDTHILVQIPTESYSHLSEWDREKRQKEDIARAKEVIGKVIRLEFKEIRESFTDEDYAERRHIAEDIKKDIEAMDFDTLSQKYNASYERVLVKSWSGTIPSEAYSSLKLSEVTQFPFVSQIQETNLPQLASPDATEKKAYSVLKIDEKLAENSYKYSYVLVDAEPSMWKPAKTEDGKILNDQYLSSATAELNEVGQSMVRLQFNSEWAQIFANLTKRLIGKQIAIFVGGETLTAPTVQAVITEGSAVITGQNSFEESKQLADNIMAGIVPAPIYLTSERTIDAKIGTTALMQITQAGIIGLLVIVVFLIIVYRVGGLLAGIALIAYAAFLIALVKLTGVVLTLAAIAGVILSIGLAIDANILIFERIREALDEKMSLNKAISLGFRQSWTAIWDSHLTSLVSAIILYIVGVSMIKWFGFMLGIGILLSLFTAMWISRVLIQFVAQFIKSPRCLVGYKQK